MLYPEVNFKQWCDRYKGLIPIERNCKCCGRMVRTTIPFALSNLRGLVTEDDGCGEEYRISTCVFATQNERNKWASEFNSLTEVLSGS